MCDLRCIVRILETGFQSSLQYAQVHWQLMLNMEKQLDTSYFFISVNTWWCIYQAIQNVYHIVSRSIYKQHCFIDFKHRREYCTTQSCTNDSLYHKMLQVL